MAEVPRGLSPARPSVSAPARRAWQMPRPGARRHRLRRAPDRLRRYAITPAIPRPIHSARHGPGAAGPSLSGRAAGPDVGSGPAPAREQGTARPRADRTPCGPPTGNPIAPAPGTPTVGRPEPRQPRSAGAAIVQTGHVFGGSTCFRRRIAVDTCSGPGRDDCQRRSGWIGGRHPVRPTLGDSQPGRRDPALVRNPFLRRIGRRSAPRCPSRPTAAPARVVRPRRRPAPEHRRRPVASGPPLRGHPVRRGRARAPPAVRRGAPAAGAAFRPPSATKGTWRAKKQAAERAMAQVHAGAGRGGEPAERFGAERRSSLAQREGDRIGRGMAREMLRETDSRARAAESDPSPGAGPWTREAATPGAFAASPTPRRPGCGAISPGRVPSSPSPRAGGPAPGRDCRPRSLGPVRGSPRP